MYQTESQRSYLIIIIYFAYIFLQNLPGKNKIYYNLSNRCDNFLRFIIILVKWVFDLQIDKRKNTNLSLMNTNCGKTTAHSQNILYGDTLFNIKVHHNTFQTQRMHSICQFVFIQISSCPSMFYLKANMNTKNNKSYLIFI